MNDIDGNLTDEQRFEQFVELCKRMYERMEQDGTLDKLVEEDRSISATSNQP